MRSLVWHILTFGIPLLGFAICTGGGVFVYRRTKQQRIGRGMAALAYLIATALPVVSAIMVMKLGNYLASSHQVFLFAGEDSWALFTFMICYFWLAVISNLVLWMALTLSRRRHNETSII